MSAWVVDGFIVGSGNAGFLERWDGGNVLEVDDVYSPVCEDNCAAVGF